MRFLLDVNALVAALCQSHPHHGEFEDWAGNCPAGDMATCALTELGFLRVANVAYGYGMAEACAALRRFKRGGPGYVEAMPSPARHMPAWVGAHQQTTDGYLCALARQQNLKLVTFDAGIKDPSALLIG